MLINWSAVIITGISTLLIVYKFDNLTLAIASLPILLGVRCCIGELLLTRKINM